MFTPQSECIDVVSMVSSAKCLLRDDRPIPAALRSGRWLEFGQLKKVFASLNAKSGYIRQRAGRGHTFHAKVDQPVSVERNALWIQSIQSESAARIEQYDTQTDCEYSSHAIGRCLATF